MSQALLACHAEGVAAKWSLKKLRMELSHRTGIDCTPTNLKRLFEITEIDPTPFGRQSMGQRKASPGAVQMLRDRVIALESDINADLVARVDLEAKFAELSGAFSMIRNRVAQLDAEVLKLKTDLGVSK